MTSPNCFRDNSGTNDEYGLEGAESGGRQSSEKAVTKAWIIIVQEVREANLKQEEAPN